MLNRCFRHHQWFCWVATPMLLAITALSMACAGLAPTATPEAAIALQTPMPQAPAMAVQPSPTPPPLAAGSEATLPTATMPPVAEAAPFLVAATGLAVPSGWFSTPIEAREMGGVVFVQQDPAQLAAFDNPALAVPADFAGGALIITDLPGGAEASSLEAGMGVDLTNLSEQEFEAMLVAADRAGLINLTAVDHTVLYQTRLDSLAGRPAMVMAGAIHFVDAQPPVLQGEIWLSWTEDSFVTFYAMATEAVWSQVEADFTRVRQSLP